MRKHALLTAVALAVMAPLGHASSQAAASLSNFRFQLEDRDDFDGVAASYGRLSNASSGSTSLSAMAADEGGDATSTKNKGQAFFQYSLNGSSDHAQAGGTIGNLTASANGSADGGNANFNAFAMTGAGGAGVLGNVMLSAHSKLTITASASVLTSATDPGGSGADWSKALASLGLTYAYGSVSYSFVDSLNASVSAGGYYDYVLNPATGRMGMSWVSGTSRSDNRNRDLQVVFENTSSQTQYATLTLLTQVSGVGAAAIVTPAIPEPASAWIALAGVGALGGVARRRRSAA